ncbi:hypothetical protein F5148DRAFT_749328 [Russula earlei]|uniref:Uncharacterized protein n=1 Tax=Russula earlei TaxID=71964 RepID=A0ACC0UF78_9AGAM|nr:hypothetical protein F5148DRAFT_749328 [Russula earlei]
MLRGVARLSLRRGIHTSSSTSSVGGLLRHRFAMAAGASVVAASYLGWRVDSESRGTIALDSDITPPPKPTTRASPEQSPDTRSSRPQDVADEKGEDVPPEGGEEASSQGAFDPATGKINWDCPCLGGMAYGPCGAQFREAFSCFVYSEEDPKGIDCVEKFKAMQDCFRENPDVYGEEFMNDDDEDEVTPTQSPNSGDAIPPSPAHSPAESTSSQESPKPA